MIGCKRQPPPTFLPTAVFDEDPKRWRMLAEAVSTVGLALEIATQIFPGVHACAATMPPHAAAKAAPSSVLHALLLLSGRSSVQSAR
jgi:hypothetical protein